MMPSVYALCLATRLLQNKLHRELLAQAACNMKPVASATYERCQNTMSLQTFEVYTVLLTETAHHQEISRLKNVTEATTVDITL